MVASSRPRAMRLSLAFTLSLLTSLAAAQPPDGSVAVEAEGPTSPETPAPSEDAEPMEPAASGESARALGAPTASTDEVPPPPSATSSGSTTPTSTVRTTTDPAVETVWQLYHDAAMAIAGGERARARELLRRVASQVEHPAATPARRLLERLEALERGRPGPFVNEAASGLARGELVVWHTLGGAGVGALVCGLAECDHVRAWTLSMIGLGALSGGVALAFSRDGVRPGRAALHGAALRWGYLDTWLLSSALGLTWKERDYGFGDVELDGTNGHLVALLIGHGFGLAGALLADHFFAPTAGDVGLMDSLHTLSGATFGFLLGALRAFDFDSQSEVRRALFPLFFGNALALGLGGWLTTKVEMTRGRSLLLDLGMLLGAGLGVGVPLLIAGNDTEPEMLFGGGAAGVVVGFTAAWFATRRMRGPEEVEPSSVDFAIAPTLGGAQASLQVQLR